jgi:enoyl-CoA hydratase/carnithine racemase
MACSTYSLTVLQEVFDAMSRQAAHTPKQIDRLVKALDRFERAPQAQGQWLRGDGQRAIWLVPGRWDLDDDRTAAVLLESDETACTGAAIRFLAGGDGRDIAALETWAERHLGI